MLHHEEFGILFRGKRDQVITVRSGNSAAKYIDRFGSIHSLPVEEILHIHRFDAGL